MASGGHRGSPPPPPSRERPDPSDDEAEEPEGEGEPEEEESEGELKGEREQTAEDEAPAGDERKTKRDPRKWHMPSPGRWCWCIYVLPMLTLLLGLALICYIPWFFSKKALRPWLFIGSRTQRTLEVTEHFHGFYRAGRVQGKFYRQPNKKLRVDLSADDERELQSRIQKNQKGVNEAEYVAASKRHDADFAHIGSTGRALTALYGEGPECRAKDYNLSSTSEGLEQVTGYHGQWRPMWWAFLIERTWQMYELLNEIWGTLERQGLQVWTVLAAFTICVCQLAEMSHDLRGATQAAMQATDPNMLNSTVSAMGNSTSDPDCAYAVGSGVANWHPTSIGTSENVIWYTIYHIMLLFMSLCLAVDATINVRFGVFAPQWNIAGHGYTTMFLIMATTTTSPDWGDRFTTPFRALVLLLFFISGAYHVILDVFLDMFGLESQTHTESRRNQRHPLQPWKEREWVMSYRLGHFDFRYSLKQRERFWNSKPCWTVRAQYWIGDQAIELQRYACLGDAESTQGKENRDGRIAFVFQDDDIFLSSDDTYDELQDSTLEGYFQDQTIEDEDRDSGLKGLIAELERHAANEREAEGSLALRLETLKKRRDEIPSSTEIGINSETGKQMRLAIKRNARGAIPTNGLQLIRGWPVQFPPVTFYDELLANPSHKVNGDMFWGNPDWHPMYYVSILAKYRAESSQGFKAHGANEAGTLWKKVVFEWIPETVEGKVQAINDEIRKEGPNRVWKRGMYKVFPITDRWRIWVIDYRRIWTMICAGCLFILHIYLLSTVCSTQATITFRAQYQKAAEAWQKNWGPDPTQCQYFKSNYVPIYVFTKNDYWGVVIMQMMIFLWHYFILGMLAAIFMVTLSNNRWWGMHCPLWLTLIGPRMSTSSVGWTLLFVVVATLQLGFFHEEPAGSWVLRIVCYISLACAISHLGYLNETLRQLYVRNPYWKLASKSPFVWIDQKKYEHAEQAKFGNIIDPKATDRDYGTSNGPETVIRPR